MGHCPPYVAVITLSVLTAHHWRTLRLRLLKAGVHNPMLLSSMHMLLDTAEDAVLDALPHDSMERTMFIDRLYSPLNDPETLKNGSPAGFTDEDVEDSFDAFAAAAR